MAPLPTCRRCRQLPVDIDGAAYCKNCERIVLDSIAHQEFIAMVQSTPNKSVNIDDVIAALQNRVAELEAERDSWKIKYEEMLTS